MGTYGLIVLFELRDEGAASGFDALVSETLPKIKASEPGTLVYAVHNVEGDSLARVFYELYVDRSAFEAHEKTAHVKHFLTKREEYVRSVRVEFLEFVDAKGVANGQ